jgi:hypothetical protein
MKIKEVTLHNTFFMAGTNFKQTISTKYKPEVELEFDQVYDWLVVKYKGKTKFIMRENIADMEPDDGAQEALVVNKTSPQVANVSGSAQVSSPHDVVFSKGVGKVRN